MTVSDACSLAAKDAFAAAARSGQLCLPTCADCGTVQYPLRDACVECLSANVQCRRVSGAGTVVSTAILYRSNDPRFASSLPLCIASVRLDAGPVLLVFLHGSCNMNRVLVKIGLDETNVPVFRAEPFLLER